MEMQRNSKCWFSKICDREVSCFCTRYKLLKWQMDNSGLPENQQRPIDLFISDLNACDRQMFIRLSEIRRTISTFIDSGSNLYICSKTTGNGKTSWAIKMLQTYLNQTADYSYEHLRGMFVSVADLLLKLKDFNNPLHKSFKDNLENVDLVVWDDMAVTGISQYDYAQLYSMINNRIFAGKSNIFTSNIVSIDELENILGARLASRIWDTSEIIQLSGGSVR